MRGPCRACERNSADPPVVVVTKVGQPDLEMSSGVECRLPRKKVYGCT